MKDSQVVRDMIRRIEAGGCWCEVSTFLVAQFVIAGVRSMDPIEKVVAIIAHERLDAVCCLAEEIERREAEGEDTTRPATRERTVH